MKNKMLIIITALGILTRAIFLFHHDIWLDEAISILIARLPIDKLLFAASFDNNPPLYYLLLHSWLQISQNPLWLRSLSLIFSVITIPATFLLAKNLTTKRIAILAALLTAIMPVQLYYAGEVRFYSLLILLASIIFYHSSKTTNNNSPITTALMTTVLVYTHYFGLFVIAAALLLARRKSLKQQKSWLKGTIIGLLLVTPWFLYTIGKPHPQPWYPNPLLSLLFMPVASTTGLTGITSPSTLNQFPMLFILIISGLALVFLLSLLSQLKIASQKALPFLFAGLMLAIAYKVPFLSPRFILPFTPLLYIWLAKALDHKPKLRATFLTLTIAALLISLTPALRGPQIKKAIARALAKQTPTFHTSTSSYFPAKINPISSHYYIGPTSLPQSLTGIIGGTPKKIEEITAEPELVLLIDQKNTDLIIKNAITIKLNSTHNLIKKEEIDYFLIQHYQHK